MVKRKRASEESLDERLEKHKTDLFRALKKNKGFERQRLSKKVRDKDNTPERQVQYELEVEVLKVSFSPCPLGFSALDFVAMLLICLPPVGVSGKCC